MHQMQQPASNFLQDFLTLQTICKLKRLSPGLVVLTFMSHKIHDILLWKAEDVTLQPQDQMKQNTQIIY